MRAACAVCGVVCVVLCMAPRASGQGGVGDTDPTSPPDGGAESVVVERESASRLASKALARIKNGAWEEAADLFRRAHQKDSSNAAIATDYGYTLAHLGKREEAERLYRLATKLDPLRFYAYVNLAELWSTDPMRWQRRDETVSFLEAAVQTLADDPKAQAHVELRLAELLRSLGRSADARVRLAQMTEATLPTQVRRRAVQLAEELDAETHERTLEDWPPPVVAPEDRAKLAKARGTADARGSLQVLDDLVRRWPAWTEARWERARLLERLGQFDEATRDLTVIVQLTPSHAYAWRRLGTLLALHGGGFEAERADEALRHALALEPSWSELRELRRQVATKRNRGAAGGRVAPAPPPTARARQLFQDAQSFIDIEAVELAPPLLRQALAESPAFVEAASALFALEHRMPQETVRALWNDGPALWRLVQAIGALRSQELAAVARPWLDRAVELGVDEARFARASLRAATRDQSGALEDLRAYVASAPSPPRLEEARALRLSLTDTSASYSPDRLAHLRLSEDRPAEALAALGGACRAGLPLENLLALGRTYEFMGNAKYALHCYQQAMSDPAHLTPAQEYRVWLRFAAAATELPPVELTRFESGLRAAKAKVALASFSLARMAEARKQWPEAEVEVRSFLDNASPDEPRIEQARALQARVSRVVEHETEERQVRVGRIRAAIALGVLAVLGIFIARWRYRQPLGRALRRQPLLFPALAKAIGRIRHDVLKHRAGALGMLSDPMTDRQDVARALLEPAPASVEVANIYRQLSQEARGLGVHLRALPAEPVFGPLAADLERAERRLASPQSAPLASLWKIDERLRGEHADKLQRLLAAGPRTTIDHNLLSRWIDGVAREPGWAGWVSPRVHTQTDHLAFPLPEQTLRSIASNLLRNAVEAARHGPTPTVSVFVEQGRDATGRRMVNLLVGDSAPAALDMETIETRPADRGLGIVRETTRTWGGEVVIREETAPLRKAVGVRFPAPPEVNS